MYEASVDMSAASMAATRMPIRPIGTILLNSMGIAISVLSPTSSGVSTASAVIPQTTGISQRHRKKKLVRV
ncbi:MAG: hypothetical protein BWX80_04082 [Candidatus Hydrogenedentes bacterium ADurb.Bin101]|nr:MAG: hypothetical protein BWX80_04082 [Candidatus Hydrogenedentes bacterium ADurb.Bin101]